MQVFKSKNENLLIIDQKKKKTLDISQIIMLRGFANYTCFYLQNGKQSLSARTLKYYEGLLNDKGFIRIHRGFLVNQKCILKHNIDTSQLILVEGHEAEISRRRKNEYLNGIKNRSSIAS
ncbi:LytTR family DNA-binding domain-containing protein [Arcicella sp. LKC2W]|uniref:LytR/AlgR family response regulator transcription factor n=1 Tax=Arcicella sp. LKC2W TaxID=2984198 RepID=UPI002B20C294|nr:LytTR family DNA-binding domain-containing protein [Arcicella sp. LKC2W]MEA5458270.1 LytTR family DNA-binding domain-containing protein [Arcicella sp. LKC2W]